MYEIDSIGLTQLMTGLNRGEDFNGRPIDAPTSFFVGVAVNPTADDLEVEVERFQEKLEAGAKFAMTQIVFDLDDLDRFAETLGGSGRSRARRRLPAHELPAGAAAAQRGAGDPRPAARCRTHSKRPARTPPTIGMAHARELIGRRAERADGVYVVAPFRRPLRVLELLS